MATPLFHPTPQHLRALVLDYLCHQSYTDTARAFARDSAVGHVDTDGDERMAPEEEEFLSEEVFTQVQLRREIKLHILSGRVNDATQLLHRHFPSILQEGVDDPRAPPFETSHTHERIHYTSQTSVNPVHLSLNLRILAFIESSRTVLLEYPPDREHAPTRLPHLDDPEAYDRHQTELLHRAQKLYSEVSSLEDGKDRETYRKELTNVGGLLAYREPEKSPMAKYLSQERREAVADQINSAILYRSRYPAISHLELYTRYTSAIWSFMHDLRVKLPPLANRPPGVALPPSAAPAQAKALAGPEKESSEAVPQFDLRQFLDAR